VYVAVDEDPWTNCDPPSPRLEAIAAAINSLPGLLESARELQALKRSQALDELVAISQEAGLYDDPPLSRPTPDVPGAEEVEAIRARHWEDEFNPVQTATAAIKSHTDRATLLRLLDAARESVDRLEVALTVMSEAADQFGDWDDDDKKLFVALRLRDLRRARALLKGT
jgi:hypothetical protein